MGGAYQCIKYVVSQAKKLNCNVERTVRNKKKFHEAEVTNTTVQKTNIERILSDIQESEKILETSFTHENVQILVGQYQQVTITYINIIGNPILFGIGSS